LLRPVTGLLARTVDMPVLDRAYWSPVRQVEVHARDEKIRDHRRRRRANDRARQIRAARKAVRVAVYRTAAAILAAGRRLSKSRQRLVVGTKTAAKQALEASGLTKRS
jgi:hypothetical protein